MAAQNVQQFPPLLKLVETARLLVLILARVMALQELRPLLLHLRLMVDQAARFQQPK